MIKTSHGKRRGSLTFEWLVIITLLVIGVINGLSALRMALNKTCEIFPEQISTMSTSIVQPPPTTP